MLKKRPYTIGFVSLGVVLTGVLVALVARGVDTGEGFATGRTVLQTRQEASFAPISLLQAWDSALDYSADWASDAAIVQLESVDGGLDTASSGENGLRNSWHVELMSSKHPSQLLHLAIQGGQVTEAFATGGPVSIGISEKPLVDSTRAIELARAALPELGPSTVKARGFHFAISAGDASIRVIGSMEGQTAFVAVDTQNGSVTTSQRLTFAKSGGVIFSDDGGATWGGSSLRGMVSAVTTVKGTTSAALAVTPNQRSLTLSRSEDSGATWDQIGSLPSEAGAWAFSLATQRSGEGLVILVGTQTGLWLSPDDGQTWERSAAIGEGAVTRIAAGNDVTVIQRVSSENGTLLSTTDLQTWQTVRTGFYRLTPSANVNGDVLAISEADNDLLRITAYGVDSSPLAANAGPDSQVLGIAGSVDGSGSTVTIVGNELRSLPKGSSEWSTILKGSFASIAASSSFESDNLMVVGGFRTGLFRTTDGGLSWTNVLPDPSTVLPGSNEIPAVLFLSPDHLIAINGGSLTWEGVQ